MQHFIDYWWRNSNTDNCGNVKYVGLQFKNYVAMPLTRASSVLVRR